MEAIKIDREGLISYIWEAYKDVNGIRPRWINFDKMTDQEIKEMADNLEKEVVAQIAREEERAKRFLQNVKDAVANTMQICKCDERRAIEIMSAEYNDIEDCLCDYGLFGVENYNICKAYRENNPLFGWA